MFVTRSPLLMAAFLAAGYTTLHSQTTDATQVLAATREALGGEKKLSAVKTFTIAGRTRQVRGNNLVPIEFEIVCELPDKYVRHDEIPAQDTDPTTVGFVGNDLVQYPAATGPSRGGPPPGGGRAGPPPAQRLMTVKQDFLRWTLG